MKNFIYGIINQKINFLKQSYNTNKAVHHQGVKGSFNEILLEELLKGVTPEKYKISKGIIQDSKGTQSNETDLIIYNPELLPSILFGNSLSFVPTEAVDYIFEIKSTLNAKEIKTTIDKFQNCKNLDGFKGRTSLFAFDSDLSKKSELERYLKYDNNFFTNPSITVLTVANKGYYFFIKTKQFVNHGLSKRDVFEQFVEKNFNNEISIDCQKLEDKELIINDINYEEIFYTIYAWHGYEVEDDENCELLGLLSGLSNTLSVEKFGKYLLEECHKNVKTYSYSIVDMWDNKAYKKIDFEGFDLQDLNLGFDLQLNEDKKKNKIVVYEKS